MFLLIAGTLLFSSCLNYYAQTAKFNTAVENGNFKNAESAVKDHRKWETNHNRLLNYMNLGRVEALQGNIPESNQMFEKAFLQIEDYHKSVSDYSLQYLVNSTMTVYLGEEHEKLYIHYFKIINFFKNGDIESALIEVRRLNIKLDRLEDKFVSNKKFQRDAFLYNIMGIAYQAAGEWNNAFIAYKKAYNIYKTDYHEFFNIAIPYQLKYDLIRSCNVLGFNSEQQFYENETGIKFTAEITNKPEVVIFWENGLVPIKDEIVLYFDLSMQNGNLMFVNSLYNMNYAIPYSSSQYQSSGLQNINLISIAIPRTLVRTAAIQSANITYNNKQYDFELGEDLGAISIKLLRDKTAQTITEELLRVALKQAAASLARKENANLGTAINLLGTFTEHAETRSWQSLPQTISYKRLTIETDKDSTFKVKYNSQSGSSEETINFKNSPNTTNIIQLTTTSILGISPIQ